MTRYAKAAVMTAQNADLEFIEYPLPRVEPGCILVKIDCCTICGSDIHSWVGNRSSPVPVILGHEIAGTIQETGGPVYDALDRRLKKGDRITWTSMDNCGKCFYCRQKGLMMKCRSIKKYGHDSCEAPPHFAGGFAEYCYLTPGTCAVRIPDNVTSIEAAPANCALACITAGWEEAGIDAFDNVLIMGAGALGIYAAALADHMGCRNIIVTDLVPYRLEMAKKFGATHVVNTAETDEAAVVEMVREVTGGFGADCAMEVAGVPSLMALGVNALRTGGRLIEMGCSFPDAAVTLNLNEILWKRLTIKGVHNYDARHLQKGIQLLSQSRGRYPFQDIVTHTRPLESINEGMRLAQDRNTIRVGILP